MRSGVACVSKEELCLAAKSGRLGQRRQECVLHRKCRDRCGGVDQVLFAVKHKTRFLLLNLGNLLAGKSFLLNHIIAYLRQEYAEDFNASVAVTAATGIAATHISGTTLHSQSGCGIPQQLEDFDRMWKQQSREKWRKLKVGCMLHVADAATR